MYSTWDNISQSLKLAWKYKILWIFALLIVGGSFSQSGNHSQKASEDRSDQENVQQFDLDDTGGFESKQYFNEPVLGTFTESTTLNPQEALGVVTETINRFSFEDFIPNIVTVGASLILAILTGIVISVIVKSWAEGSLIKGTQVAIDLGEMNLRDLSSNGRISFRRIVYLQLLLLLLVVLGTVVLGLVPSILVIAKQETWAIVVGILLFILYLLFVIRYGFAYIYAVRFIVLKGLDYKDALKRGLAVFGKNVGTTLKLFFANCLVQLLIGGAVLAVVVGVVFTFLNNLIRDSALIIFAFPLAIMGLILFPALSGYLNAFSQITWTKLFNHLERSNENGN